MKLSDPKKGTFGDQGGEQAIKEGGSPGVLSFPHDIFWHVLGGGGRMAQREKR